MAISENSQSAQQHETQHTSSVLPPPSQDKLENIRAIVRESTQILTKDVGSMEDRLNRSIRDIPLMDGKTKKEFLKAIEPLSRVFENLKIKLDTSNSQTKTPPPLPDRPPKATQEGIKPKGKKQKGNKGRKKKNIEQNNNNTSREKTEQQGRKQPTQGQTGTLAATPSLFKLTQANGSLNGRVKELVRKNEGFVKKPEQKQPTKIKKGPKP